MQKSKLYLSGTGAPAPRTFTKSRPIFLKARVETFACVRASAMSDAAAGSSNDGAESASNSGAVACAGRSDDAASTAFFAKSEAMKKSRLELLKTTDEMVHIISTPFDSEQGSSLAREVAQACELSGTMKAFCYNPNEDCPQTLGVSWLKTWMAICDNTARTRGRVFVIFRSDGKGKYSCDKKGPWSLDGQAQEGEIAHALSKRCHVHWLDSTNPEATMRELASDGPRHQSKRARIDGGGSSALAQGGEAQEALAASLAPPLLNVAVSSSDASISSPSLNHQASHFQGQTVIIHGLKAKPEYNGKTGRLMSWDENKERWSVQLRVEGIELQIALRAVNLQAPQRWWEGDAPDLAPHFIDKTAEIRTLQTKLVHANTGIIVHGMGGLGKSMLLSCVLRDAKTREVCPDGAVWIQMSTEAQPLACLKYLVEALARLLYKPSPCNDKLTTISNAKEEVVGLLKGTRVLILVDDVWSLEQVLAIHQIVRRSDGSRLLISTRNSMIIDDINGEAFKMPFLQGHEALQLLCSWAKADSVASLRHDADAMKVAAWCGVGEGKVGGVPLALRAVGRLAVRFPWADVLKKLERKQDNMQKLACDAEYRTTHENSRYSSLFGALNASLEELAEDNRKSCVTLGMFMEDDKIPLTILQALWNVEELTAKEVLDVLFMSSLVIEGGAKKRYVRLHDLQREFLRHAATREATKAQEQGWHASIVRSVGTEISPSGSPGNPYWYALEGRRRLLYHLNELSNPMLSEPLQLIGGANLKVLNLSYEPLERLPQCIGFLTQLETLLLNQCEKLQALPSSFGDLKNLWELNLEGCKQLSTLDGCNFERLENLTHLDCCTCERLAVLPPRINELVSLRCVSFKDCNKLVNLPLAMASMPSIQRLDLRGCKDALDSPASNEVLSLLRAAREMIQIVATKEEYDAYGHYEEWKECEENEEEEAGEDGEDDECADDSGEEAEEAEEEDGEDGEEDLYPSEYS